MDPRLFALAGMAAMVGASTGGVITGILLVSEMTHDYRVLMVTIIATTVAYGVRKYFCFPSIYTLKTLRRGHNIPEGVQAGNLSSQQLINIMTRNIITKIKGKRNTKGRGGTSKYIYHIIKENNKVIGYQKAYLGKLSKIKMNFVILNHKANLLDALRHTPDTQSTVFLITDSKDPHQIIGVVTEKDVLKCLKNHAIIMV